MVSFSLVEKIRNAAEADKIVGRKIYTIFSALGDTNRFLLFKFLLEHNGLCVSDVARIFSVSVSAASQQLKVLENCGLIERNRYGQKICYEVKSYDPLVQSVVHIVSI